MDTNFEINTSMYSSGSKSSKIIKAQFSLNNVHKRGLKHHHFISSKIMVEYIFI